MSRAKKVKFKRNDRVYVRASNIRCTGIVECIRGSGEINGVKSYDVRVRVIDIKDLAGKSPFFWFPEHVCKLLKSKKPKPARVWNNKRVGDYSYMVYRGKTPIGTGRFPDLAIEHLNRLERKIARLEAR